MESLSTYASSRQIEGGQVGLHPRLRELVFKHLLAPAHGPVAEHTVDAFNRLQDTLGEQPAVIFDSGCGTGESTVELAQRHPDCWVVGIDKSADRLRRGRREILQVTGRPGPVWLRAEVGALWRLAAEAGWQLHRHYLLYPNPWPKRRQLGRRFHGHSSFRYLVELGGRFELRSNWDIYAKEMQAALQFAGVSAQCKQWVGDNISHFEEKYSISGHKLWRLQADFTQDSTVSPGQS